MNLADVLAGLAKSQGLNVVPGQPETDITQLVSRIARGNAPTQGIMPFAPIIGADPAAGPMGLGGPGPAAPQAAAGEEPQTGGYMNVGFGLGAMLPKQTMLPPPETEPTAPQARTSPISTGSIPGPEPRPTVGLLENTATPPDFSSSFAHGLVNVGNALQGKSVVDLDEQNLSRNMTYRALIGRGLDPASAEAAVRNPSVLTAILPAVFNPTKNLTDDQREYELARRQGFNGSFLDYITSIKRAGSPQFSVNNDMRAENAESQARGQGLGKRLNDIAADGSAARQDLAMFSRLATLASNVNPGTKTALFEELRDLTGVTLDPNTDNVQAFKAAVNYLAPRMRVTGSGSSSDRDVSIFFKALPSLLGTPEGNKLAVETLGGLAQNRISASRIAAQWQRGEISAAQADKMMDELEDPFKAFKQSTFGMRATEARDLPTLTPEQAAKAPPGTRFKDVDGRVRTRE